MKMKKIISMFVLVSLFAFFSPKTSVAKDADVECTLVYFYCGDESAGSACCYDMEDVLTFANLLCP